MARASPFTTSPAAMYSVVTAAVTAATAATGAVASQRHSRLNSDPSMRYVCGAARRFTRYGLSKRTTTIQKRTREKLREIVPGVPAFWF